MYSPNTQIYDRPLTWLGTGSSINRGGVKPVLWSQPSLWVKCCFHVSVFYMWVRCRPSHITGSAVLS